MKHRNINNVNNSVTNNTKALSDRYLNDLANKLFKSLVEPIKYDRRLIDLGYKPKDLKQNTNYKE